MFINLYENMRLNFITLNLISITKVNLKINSDFFCSYFKKWTFNIPDLFKINKNISSILYFNLDNHGLQLKRQQQ